jgi:hypothetical protein
VRAAGVAGIADMSSLLSRGELEFRNTCKKGGRKISATPAIPASHGLSVAGRRQELCRYASACLPESLILGLVPLGRAAAVGVEDIAGEVGDRISGATVRRVLSRLVSEGEVRSAPGAASGRQVTAVGYWRPSDDEEIA